MLKEAKKWVQQLETTINELAQEFNEEPEAIEEAFENWYYDGGQQWDFEGRGPTSVEAFARQYRDARSEAIEGEAYEVVYQKMRTFAARRGYDIQDWEIDRIVEGAEEDGDSILDCSDEALREGLEDWIADHQE